MTASQYWQRFDTLIVEVTDTALVNMLRRSFSFTVPYAFAAHKKPTDILAVTDTVFNGRQHHNVKMKRNTLDTVLVNHYLFDAETHLLTAQTSKNNTAYQVYKNYRHVGNFLVAHTSEQYTHGFLYGTTNITSIQFNMPLPDSLFQKAAINH